MSVDVQELFSPVQQGNLKDVVYAKIRAAILGGQIRPARGCWKPNSPSGCR